MNGSLTVYLTLALVLLVCSCQHGEDPTTASPEIPPEFSHFLESIARLQHGASVDLDGDGKLDASSTVDADGTFHLLFDADGDGTPEYGSDERPDGSGSSWTDRDQDHVREWEESHVVAPSPVEITLEDEDGDGRKETRVTEAFDEARGTLHVVVERDATGGGSFSVVSDTLTSDEQRQGSDKCAGFAGFPTNVGDPAIHVAGVSIPFDGGGGRCTEKAAKRLLRALVCALFPGEDCLRHMQSPFAGEILKTFATKKVTIGCSLDCVDTRGVMRARTGQMNINAGYLLVDDDGEVCQTMLHELIHWAGARHKDAEGAGDDATDRIYACARYCGGCRDDATPNLDCARCAGLNALAKEECGTKTEQEVGMSCPSYALCHGGIFTNRPGETCEFAVTKYCDDSDTAEVPEFVCVKDCPSDAQRCNDMPCESSPPTSCTKPPAADRTDLGSCGMPPPACR